MPQSSKRRYPGSRPVISDALLELNIVSGPPIATLFVLSAALFLYLLVRAPTRPWILASASALLAGGTLAVLTWLIVVKLLHAVRIPLSPVIYYWLVATMAGVALAAVNLWRSRWWRKLTATAAILV